MSRSKIKMTEPNQAVETKPDTAGKERISSLSVDANQLIELLSKELKSVPQIKAPPWAPFVKTGTYKERPPVNADWWYIRTAAILRTVARLGPVGTSKLRTKFGGKHSRGYKSERFARGSGSIIRKAMQQLETAGLIKQTIKGVHKGRIITEKAASLMDSLAQKVTVAPRKAYQARPSTATPVQAFKAENAPSTEKKKEGKDSKQ